MQLLKFVPIKLTLFLVLGILIGNYFNFTLISILSITFISLIILGWLFVTHKSTKSALFGIITFILTICIGILSTSIHNSKNSQNHYSKFSISELDMLHLKITEVLKPNSFSARYYAKVTVLNKNKTEGKILLIIPNDSSHTNLNIDQELITYAKIDEINAPLNPHEFDYKNYLENIGVYNQIYAKSS